MMLIIAGGVSLPLPKASASKKALATPRFGVWTHIGGTRYATG